TEQDVIEGRKNDDSVARCTYWIDIHCPFGRTINTHLCYKECQTSEYCVMLDKYRDYLPSKDKLYPPDNDWFSIPSRCLMPEKAKNLLVAGRCISADHKAMGATRVMATCMATGDAAGAIASVCLNEKCDAQSVPVKKAQKTIEQLGGLF
ncbi:MAG: FAD-dependent oxidoreductase, partial [Candidatus Omnitrophica bacterium]|nr:FAD-dependent oxidoreductase [Candidatus Omnitrophota bacterium]